MVAHGFAGELFGGDHGADGVVPVFGPGEIDGIIGTQPVGAQGVGGLEVEQPAGIAAAIPLGADVGAGADDGVEAEFVLGHLQPVLEIGQVHLGEVVEAGGLGAFVPVPGDVGFNGVEAGGLDLLKAVAPEGLGAAEVVEGTAVDEGVLTVDGEAMAVVVDAVGMGELLGGQVGGRGGGGGEQEAQARAQEQAAFQQGVDRKHSEVKHREWRGKCPSREKIMPE